ncbi:MAG: succinate dehydrogenase cytochrome b subunit [Acidobacteriota bacterium]|nr:succinate dehydrogenase cytochrome b subunit [Acidobacteriota bacterium]
MSSIAVGSPSHRAFRFYDSTVFKKAVMAITGLILFAFVVGHLIGNLQIYEGPEKLDAYGHFLHSIPVALWTTRIVLLVAVCLHIIATIQLARLKTAARPIGYVKKDNSHSSYASRTMYWSGPIIALFIIYHILHLSLGVAQPNGFVEGSVYKNVVLGFQNWFVSGFYIVAMAMLCLHLYHGVYSMFQSLGLHHPNYTPFIKKFAATMAILIALGNISIPVAVLAGWVK